MKHLNNHIFLLLSLLLCGFLGAQNSHDIEFSVISGASGNTSGTLIEIQGQEPVVGTVSFMVGQPFVTANGVILSGEGQKVELGVWNTLKRRPENPSFSASYDIYADRVDLGWKYDANDPQATNAGTGHDIFRDNTQIRNDYLFVNSDYTDIGASIGGLTPGTEYSYEIRGSNLFGTSASGPTVVGKTSTNGSVDGLVETALGTNIPDAKMTLKPNWGHSIFLDGVDDVITFPNNEIFDILNESVNPNLTLELWFKTENNQSQPLLSKGDGWELGLIENDGFMYPVLTSNGSTILTGVNSVSNDEFHHISLVKIGGNTLKLYIDGVLQSVNDGESSVVFSPISSSANLMLMGKNANGDQFRGYVDEFRLWSEARDLALGDSTILKRDYNRYLNYRNQGVVSEPQMLFYANMDVGFGDEVVNAVDQEVDGLLSGRTDTDYWSSEIAPVFAVSFTNEEGQYQINGVNYGDGTNFTLTPSKPYHVFNPSSRNVYLSDDSPVKNDIDFTVTNLQTISGFVKYDTDHTDGAECGQANVRIWVNGQPTSVLTENDGGYRLEVEPGATVTIQPKKDGREELDFFPISATFTNVITPKTTDFSDLKTRKLQGKVGGGVCMLSLGPAGFAQVTLSSTQSCFEATVPIDDAGNYTFLTLPIMEYQISVSINVDPNYVPPVPNKFEMNTHFINSGASIDLQDSYNSLDSVWVGAADTIDFPYFAPLEIEFLSGFNQNVLEDNMFSWGESDTVDIFVYEKYYDNQDCPLETGYVKIRDYIGDKYNGVDSDTLIMPINNGLVRYAISAGLPNLSPNGDYPYQKKFEVLGSDTFDVRQATHQDYAVVLGYIARNVDFTTTSAEIPLMILRRPPGDGSSSSWSETESMSTSFSVNLESTHGTDFTAETKVGIKTSSFIGIGIGVINTTESAATITNETSFQATMTSEHEQSWSLTRTTDLSTFSDDAILGRDSDIFFGAAINLLYGVCDELILTTNSNGEWIYEVKPDIIVVPDGFETTYIYTRHYIENTLIPELEMLGDYYEELESDSAVYYYANVANWQSFLAREDSLLQATNFEDNYSFSGAAGDFSVTTSETVSESNTWANAFELSNDFKVAHSGEIFGSGFDYENSLSFSITTGSSISTSTENTTEMSFTLADDDEPDDYSVDVGYDPVYGSPVFQVVAGHSSCPYEEWQAYDPTQDQVSIVTTPVDEPYMEWLSPSTATNILPGDVAEFEILLRNDSPSEAERTYYLSFVAASNPLGANVKINGQLDAIPISLEYLETETALITVSKPDNSDDYDFNGLRVKFAPECEANYAGVTEGYTLPFDVNFAKPCSDVEIYIPNDNWVLNTYNQDTLSVTFTGYDLGQSYLDSIMLQYSPLAESNWYTIPDAIVNVDSLREYDFNNYTVNWDVSNLEDGLYDIRMRSWCLSGVLTNEMQPISGTIDRQIPILLGNPNPVDGILNQNDQIGFIFTENIDPVSVEPIKISLYDPYGIGEITAFDLSANENTVIISPIIENRFIENHELTASMWGYSDMYGNPGDTVQWTFIVNRNPVSWSTPEISQLSFLGEGSDFELQINNIGSNAEAFSIIDIPEWLSVSPVEGTLNPGGSFDISFSIDPTLNSGEYQQRIEVETSMGNEPLDLDIISMCQYPNWNFDPNFYEFSMNITAEIAVQGSFSEDEYDRVGAFISGEPRGFANIIYNENLDSYLAFLTIYSNEYIGESIDFHIWDRTACSEYWEVDSVFTFQTNSFVGSPLNPILIHANGKIGQSFDMNEGFSWLSLNLLDDDMSFNTFLEDVMATEGDRIIGQDAFAEYASDGWVGPLLLEPIQLGSMYQIDLSQSNETTHTGYEVGPDTIDIPLNDGWNWIGYLPNENMNINIALADLNSVENDLLKGQYGFAQYVDGFGWIGSQTRMFPEEGYMISIANRDTLTYPNATQGDSDNTEFVSVAVNKYVDNRTAYRSSLSNDNKDLTENVSPWVLNDVEFFSSSMTLTAIIESDTFGINDPNDVIVARVGEEVRGIASPTYVPELDQYRVFMMIYGDESGDEINFRIWNSKKEKEFKTPEVIPFYPNDMIGNPINPIALASTNLDRWDDGYIPEQFSLYQNYPNPFNPTTRIGFSVPDYSNVKIRLFDVVGREVRTLVNGLQEPGYREVLWNGRNNLGQPVSAGIYFAEMEAGGYRNIRKLILLK